jgi:hypothetical protein
MASLVISMDWLPNFFHEAFTAAGPLGLAAFAMVVIVALVGIVVAISQGRPLLVAVGVIAIACVAGIFVFNQLHPGVQLIPSKGNTSAAAPPAPPNGARWFDTGMQADWGGKDSFYSGGQFPVYEAPGIKLCDDNLLGRVATCWSSRPADATTMAPGVPTNININEKRLDWCAYKDSNVTLASRQDGVAPGRVFACAHSISP